MRDIYKYIATYLFFMGTLSSLSSSPIMTTSTTSLLLSPMTTPPRCWVHAPPQHFLLDSHSHCHCHHLGWPQHPPSSPRIFSSFISSPYPGVSIINCFMYNEAMAQLWWRSDTLQKCGDFFDFLNSKTQQKQCCLQVNFLCCQLHHWSCNQDSLGFKTVAPNWVLMILCQNMQSGLKRKT